MNKAKELFQKHASAFYAKHSDRPPPVPYHARPGFASNGPSNFINYPFPSGEPQSQDYAVFVQGQPVFVYTSWQLDYEHTHRIQGRPVSPVSFASFDIWGQVEVRIQYLNGHSQRQASNVVIRPLSHQIQASSYPGGCSFILDRPCQLSIEPNGSRKQPLHLFANPVAAEPNLNDPNTIHFGPGVHEISSLDLQGGQTLHLAGGAVVYLKPLDRSKCPKPSEALGCQVSSVSELVHSGWSENITVCGRGILCARRALDHGQRAGILGFQEIKNLKIEGVILRESANWTANFVHCEGLRIDNVKALGHYANNDGFVISSSDVVVSNCFAHVADDSFEIKSWEGHPVSQVAFEHCVSWTDVGGSFAIPAEVRSDITNVRFSQCTVIHSTLPSSTRCPIDIHLEGPGNIRSVSYDSIVVEDCEGRHRPPIRITNGDWEPPIHGGCTNGQCDPQRNGSITDLSVSNIQVLQCEQPSVELRGSPEKPIHGVQLSSIVIGRERLGAGDPRVRASYVQSLQVL